MISINGVGLQLRFLLWIAFLFGCQLFAFSALAVSPTTSAPNRRPYLFASSSNAVTGTISGSIEDKFQVNRNSIIRTHDSRTMGAKYLNESSLNSNDECLWWCWNTSSCNLAVFEEKGRRNCFLFDCGSIDAFKCRLSSHAFYTSSVLQVNRNSFFLQEWKTQASQESELNGLKALQSTKQKSDLQPQQQLQQQQQSMIKVANSNDIYLNKQSALLGTSTIEPSAKVSKCRHYQFECRNNSECIAIYNVCDGIPQCSDASDEATDLQCHKSRVGSGKPAIAPNVESFAAKQPQMAKANSLFSATGTGQQAPQQQQQAQLSPISSIFGGKSSSPIDTNDPNSNNNLFTYQQAAGNAAAYSGSFNYPRSPNEKISDENMLYNSIGRGGNGVNDYAGGANSGPYSGSIWNQFSSPNEPYNNVYGGVVDQSDQYGALKENSLPYWPSSSSSAATAYQQAIDSSPPSSLFRHTAPSSSGDYSPLYNNNGHGNNNNNINGPVSMLSMQLSDSRRSFSLPFTNRYANGLSGDHNNAATSIVSNSSGVGNLHSTDKSIAAAASTINNGTAVPAPAPSYAHISNSRKEVTMTSPIRTQFVFASGTLHVANGQQSGHETNSAVIALTLGLFITVILVVIVGCRMKSFKKRIARRGRSLAHDADYLVNGMYL